MHRHIKYAVVVLCFVLVYSVGSRNARANLSMSNVLITVDITNPNAVVFSATGNAPIINDSSTNTLEGVTLLSLFEFDALINTSTFDSSTLLPNGGGSFFYTNFGSAFDAVDLLIFRNESAPPTQDFMTNAPAFTGSATADLNGFTFSSMGYGDIIAGLGTSESGQVIGQWQIVTDSVVPEPTTALLGLMGLAACGQVMLRRRKA